MISNSKSVSFALHPEIKILYTWHYANQQARRGTWHIEAIDRVRFHRRIDEMKSILEPVLHERLNKIKNL